MKKNPLQQLRKQFEAYISHLSSKGKYFLFFSTAFLALVGIFFFGKLAFEQIPSSSFLKKVLPIQETVIDYPSQTILIDTPFATDMPIKEPIFPDKICSIADFGAIPDGKTSNTQAFQKAIDSCADAGGGKVLVPPGIWFTGPIRLKSNIELHIERDATILFSANPKDYLPVVFSRFEGIEYYNYAPPIYAADSTNVAVTGVGTINGQGPTAWWKFSSISINKLYGMGDDNIPLAERTFGNEADGLRPAFIEFINCHNVLIEDIKILNGPMWTIHPVYSDNVIVRGVDIQTSPGPSTDGVAVDSSSYVLIENSTFDTGDDAIVLKSGRDKDGMRIHHPTENVVIRNNTIKDAHGAVAIGSEISGDIRNVFATDIAANTVQFGFRIKATLGRGGIVENIWAQNFTMRRVSNEAIEITTSYGLPFREDSVALPVFRNIHVNNFTSEKTPRAINIDGLPTQPISDIFFENMNLTTRLGIEMKNVHNINFKDIQLTSKDNEPLFTILDSTNITVDHSPCPISTLTCLTLQGEKSENINIQNSEIEKKKIKVFPGVKSDALIN